MIFATAVVLAGGQSTPAVTFLGFIGASSATYSVTSSGLIVLAYSGISSAPTVNGSGLTAVVTGSNSLVIGRVSIGGAGSVTVNAAGVTGCATYFITSLLSASPTATGDVRWDGSTTGNVTIANSAQGVAIVTANAFGGGGLTSLSNVTVDANFSSSPSQIVGHAITGGTPINYVSISATAATTAEIIGATWR